MRLLQRSWVERTHALDVVHLHHDGLGLGLADPDGKEPLTVLLLENDDVRLRRAIEPQSRDDDFDHTWLDPPDISGPRV